MKTFFEDIKKMDSLFKPKLKVEEKKITNELKKLMLLLKEKNKQKKRE